MGQEKIFHFSLDLDWIPGSYKSMDGIFNLIEKYDIKPTLFFTGRFAQDHPEIIKECVTRNYEIGCHGWKHGFDTSENYGHDVRYEIQRKLILKSTETIEKISGIRPKLFRAPRCNISGTTFRILSELNYLIDSSITPGRFDFGLGTINTFRNFTTPQSPYLIKHPLAVNPVLEVPLTALIFPFNMRTIRVFGFSFLVFLMKMVAKRKNRIVFYTHPTEFVKPEEMRIPQGENLQFYRNCSPDNFIELAKFIDVLINSNYRFDYMTESTLNKGTGFYKMREI